LWSSKGNSAVSGVKKGPFKVQEIGRVIREKIREIFGHGMSNTLDRARIPQKDEGSMLQACLWE